MAESISCPHCQRRLRLPSDFQAELVRCPSCETAFPLAAALAEPSPILDALPADEPSPPRSPPRSRAPKWEEVTADDEPRSVAARRSSRSPCLVAALVVGAVVLMVGVGVTALVVIAWRASSPATTYAVRDEEDEEERREQLRAAFKKNLKPVADDEIAQQVQPLFDELAAALRAQDADRISAQFDPDRMVDEFIAAGGEPLLRTAKDRNEFRRGVRRGLGKSLAQRGQLFQWNATEIRKIKRLNDDHAAIIARHKHPNGSTLKMRWWVTRRDGDWKVYDFEDLDTAMRLSSEIAAFLGQGIGQVMETARAVKAVSAAIQALAQDDVDGAEKGLAEVEGHRLPSRFEALRQLAKGMILMRREKNKEALKTLEKAHRLHPDMPMADFLRGVVLNKLGKPAEALKHLEAYRDLLGEDADVCREIGESLREQRRFPEAAKEYRKSLDFNPKEADSFLGLLHSIGGDDKKDDVGPRFAKLDSRRENFDIFAADCERREFPDLLDPLVRTMLKLDPNYPPVVYYQALVQARTGHPDEAARSFQSALGKQPNEQQRREYEQQFLKAMASGGHYAKAYSAAADARAAFRFLAAEAAKRYRLDELKKLATAHAKQHAADPLLPLYRAEIHVREGQYDKADKAFTEATAHRLDAETLEKFRASRVLARYHTGQAMSAYRDIGPREETFAQLASLFFQNDQDTQLQTLLDAHAKESPNSDKLIRYRYRLLIRRNKTADGIALFQSALAKTKEEQHKELVSEFLWDMVAAGKPVEGYRAAPDAVDAFRQLMDGMMEDDRWDEMRRLAEAHRRGHADDPWLAYYRGEIHLHDKAWDKAATVLREALKRQPKAAREQIQWSYVFALYKTGHWEQAYAEVEPRDKTFTQLANLLANDKKGVELEGLVRAHKRQAADAPELLYYEARAKVMTKKWAEAVPLFQQAYRKQSKEHLRTSYQWGFLHDLAEAGQWREGYRAAVDKKAALNTLAGDLLSRKKDKELAALLEEHHKDGGGEPWYSFYLGEMHLLRGDAKEAARHFAIALSKGGATEQWRLRDGLFRARVRAGEATVAYAECKTYDGAFGSLAFQCSQKKDAKQLQALLDAHRKVKPDDPNLVSWEVELLLLKQDHEGALRLLTERRDDIFSQPAFRWKADGQRIRCLVKLKRGEEAVRAAEDVVNKRSGDRLLLVLAHAAAGDVPGTIAAMGKLGKATYFVRRCYQDDDLGPLVRSEGFAAFREKFPEPKEEKTGDDHRE